MAWITSLAELDTSARLVTCRPTGACNTTHFMAPGPIWGSSEMSGVRGSDVPAIQRHSTSSQLQSVPLSRGTSESSSEGDNAKPTHTFPSRPNAFKKIRWLRVIPLLRRWRSSVIPLERGMVVVIDCIEHSTPTPSMSATGLEAGPANRLWAEIGEATFQPKDLQY